MPKQITAYQAEDGTIHADVCAAASRDLELLIAGSPLAENAPYAKTVLAWLKGDSARIITHLQEYEVACPKRFAKKAVRKVEGEPEIQGEPAAETDGDCA